MKRLLRILAVDSVTDLFRYKSFFFLIFFLIAADRVLRKFLGRKRANSRWDSISSGAGNWLFMFSRRCRVFFGTL